ncbi:cell wall hydrolase [Alicyclobacillus suci]|uniref:cell wall hydrolase n=1 Tax=Alicyclobacillus suci TaxID=2816080 RepID=UPI001A8E6F48|nr:cell wall hydrolase [Alicyclobacillus suci]
MRLSRLFVGTFTAAAVWGLAMTPAFAATTVTVQPGDSLWKISHARGISLQSLESANPSVNPADLLVGTVLKLPTTSNVDAANSNDSTEAQNLYWMEHIINAEAGGESLEAQVAVGDVVLHRLESGQYGKTVHDVVFQIDGGHYQFSCVPDGYIYQTPNASSVTAAERVLETNDDEVPGAFVFYNPAQTLASSWVRSQKTIAQIGDLVFAK